MCLLEMQSLINEQIELQAKLLNYFSESNKSNINQSLHYFVESDFSTSGCPDVKIIELETASRKKGARTKIKPKTESKLDT